MPVQRRALVERPPAVIDHQRPRWSARDADKVKLHHCLAARNKRSQLLAVAPPARKVEINNRNGVDELHRCDGQDDCDPDDASGRDGQQRSDLEPSGQSSADQGQHQDHSRHNDQRHQEPSPTAGRPILVLEQSRGDAAACAGGRSIKQVRSQVCSGSNPPEPRGRDDLPLQVCC